MKLPQGAAARKAFLSDKDFVDLSKDDKNQTGEELQAKANSRERKKRGIVDVGMMKILRVLKGNYDSENGGNVVYLLYTLNSKRCQAKSLISCIIKNLFDCCLQHAPETNRTIAGN